MIELKNIVFSHSLDGSPVLRDISIKIENTGVTTILGPNGCGKTTLLKCIAGLWKVKKGFIEVAGKNLRNLEASQRAKLISYVPQNHQPVFPYTVTDVVLMGRTPHLNRFAPPQERDRLIVDEALKALEIDHLSDRIYSKLSGGERQLVLIARSLAQQSSLMLLDEPVSHLDFKNQIKVMSLIRRISEEKKLTVMITLHDPNLAAAFSEKLILIKKGCLLHQGTVDQMITSEMLSELYDMNIVVGNGNGNWKWVYSPNV